MRLSLRTNFAILHLRAAANAARNAHDVESQNATAEFGPWFDEMLLSVPVSIVMGGAALEATANELIQDLLDGSPVFSLTRGCKCLLADLKEDRSGNAIGKFRQLALLLDKEADTGSLAWQDADLLVKFRNSFMHFKPAWDHDSIHTGKLTEGLKSRIKVVGSWHGNFLFPYGFMTYDCAKWSVSTVLAFSHSFSLLLGVHDKFAGVHSDFRLP
jgi:hypothetical protein